MPPKPKTTTRPGRCLTAGEAATLADLSPEEFDALVLLAGVTPAVGYKLPTCVGLAAASFAWHHSPAGRKPGTVRRTVRVLRAMPENWFANWVAGFDTETHYDGKTTNNEPHLRDPRPGEVLFDVKKCYLRAARVLAGRGIAELTVSKGVSDECDRGETEPVGTRRNRPADLEAPNGSRGPGAGKRVNLRTGRCR